MKRVILAVLSLLFPIALIASPAETFAARFIDVLRRDDMRVVTELIDDPMKSLETWRELRDLIDRYDCISIGGYEWTVVSATDDRLALRIDLTGTYELKADWRPRFPLPRTWHVEARRNGDDWLITRVLTEERRVAETMASAPSQADAERILLETRHVDTILVLVQYRRELRRKPEWLEHAVGLAQRHADVATEVLFLRDLLLAQAGRDNERAIKTEQYLETLVRTSGSKDDIMSALYSIGAARNRRADYEGSFSARRESGAMVQEVDDPTLGLKALQGYWNMLDDRSLFEGLLVIEQIEEFSNRYRWEEGHELALQDRYAVQSRLGYRDLARATTLELIRRGKQHGNRMIVNYSYRNLGVLELQDHRYREAVDLLRMVAPDFRRDVGSYSALAWAHIELGELDEAEAALYEAEKLNVHKTVVYTSWKALIQLKRGQPEKAIETIQRAHDNLDPALSAEAFSGMGTLARAQRQLGRTEEAIAAMRDFLSWTETDRQQLRSSDPLVSALLLHDSRQDYLDLAQWLVEANRIEEAFRVSERMKARGLRDAMEGVRIDVSAEMTDAERARERDLEERITGLNRSLFQARQKGEPIAPLEKELVTARHDFDAFRAEIHLRYPGVARLRASDDVAIDLPKGSDSLTVVEYLVAPTQVLAFVVAPGVDGSTTLRVERLPLPRRELERQARELAQLVAARSPAYRDAAKGLYAALVAPLEPHLRGAKTLAIIPDGVLWTVPFHALMAPDGKHLVEQRAVFYAHSLALLRSAMSRRTAAPSSLLAFGNPAIGTGAQASLRSAAGEIPLGPLTDAEEEVRTISSLYPAQRSLVHVRENARETAFKEQAARFGILHVAAHAVVEDGAPMYSAIALSPAEGTGDDGLLEAREIVNLPLNAELAVLSACDTARGRIGTGDGVIGLPWAFFAAGCPTTIVSQWSAESAATARLMVELHRRLVRGESVATALRGAQLSVRRIEKYRHPFYWAPFVAIGAAGRGISAAHR